VGSAVGEYTRNSKSLTCSFIAVTASCGYRGRAGAIPKVGYPVIQSTAFDVQPTVWSKAKELEMEGVITKRKGSP
jgi:hypothetical protein